MPATIVRPVVAQLASFATSIPSQFAQSFAGYPPTGKLFILNGPTHEWSSHCRSSPRYLRRRLLAGKSPRERELSIRTGDGWLRAGNQPSPPSRSVVPQLRSAERFLFDWANEPKSFSLRGRDNLLPSSASLRQSARTLQRPTSGS